MKITYTESALIELERFQSHRKEELESLLKNRKYVFGDDAVEITASDIRDAEKYFKVETLSKSKLPLTNMLLKTYMVAGIVMVGVGLFYPDLKQLVDRNPIQITLVLGGAMLSFTSFIGSYYFRMRNIRRYDMEQRYAQFEMLYKLEKDSDSDKKI